MRGSLPYPPRGCTGRRGKLSCAAGRLGEGNMVGVWKRLDLLKRYRCASRTEAEYKKHSQMAAFAYA